MNVFSYINGGVFFMDKKDMKTIRVVFPDGKVWDSFLGHIKSVYGKTYGYIGFEVQNALIQYIKAYHEPSIAELKDGYEKELQELEKSYINEIKPLKIENYHLREFKGTYDSLFQDYQQLRNNYDHLQARFNKSQEDLNNLEREISQLRVVVAKIEKLSFLERLFNRLPNEIKQLKEG
jgi:predicted nuclease with TOPRIM domain